MSQLAKSDFDSRYNKSASGYFYDNNTRQITAGTIRQFAKDIEDSIPFLNDPSPNFTGVIVIGDYTFFDSTALGLVSAVSTSDPSTYHLNGYFYTKQLAANSHSIQGVEGYINCAHPSGTVTLAIGAIGNIELSTGSTITEARSVDAGGNLTGAGTITDWYLYWANMVNSGGGTITNGYGFYCGTFPAGVTNKYGVYIADSNAKSGFGVLPTAIVDISASTNSRASLRIRSGIQPSSPNDGDIWYDGTNIKIRVGGTTKTFTIT